jgi:hypothetical protein
VSRVSSRHFVTWWTRAAGHTSHSAASRSAPVCSSRREHVAGRSRQRSTICFH